MSWTSRSHHSNRYMSKPTWDGFRANLTTGERAISIVVKIFLENPHSIFPTICPPIVLESVSLREEMNLRLYKPHAWCHRNVQHLPQVYPGRTKAVRIHLHRSWAIKIGKVQKVWKSSTESKLSENGAHFQNLETTRSRATEFSWTSRSYHPNRYISQPS